MLHRYMTRGDAKALLRSACATDDDTRLNNYLEDVRQIIFSLYEDNDYVPNIVRCFPVECFCHDICYQCETTYRGVSLCKDMQTVEAIWYNDPANRVTLQDDWRNWSPMIQDYRDCRVVAEDVAGFFPTERSISPCGCCAKVKLSPRSPQDSGKKVRLRFCTSDSHDVVEELITLHYGFPQCTSECVCHFMEGGVILEDDLCGEVVMSQAAPENETSGYPGKYDGRLLSIYAPGEKVPSYRRINLVNLPSSVTHVNIRAARRMCALTNDWDVVETDNRMAIQWIGKAVRLLKKDNITNRDMEVSDGYITKARQLLVGDKVRDRGKRKPVRFHMRGSMGTRARSLNRWR